MVFDYEKYVRNFKAKSTAWHLKNYKKHNSTFREIARDELKKRLRASDLRKTGITRKKRKKQLSFFSLGGW
jgi:hypothetical protein